jgi:N6-adenosine-specific RNA methylase IME4
MQITIDPEFQALIPPLQPMEIAELEASLKAEGCREPLAIWRGALIDGHNRYQICQRAGVQFETREMSFESREHAKLWMIRNQKGRRNLSEDQRGVLALVEMELRSEIAKRERATKGGRPVESYTTDSKKITGNNLLDNVSNKKNGATPLIAIAKAGTRAAVAKEVKIPERKLRDLAEIKKRAPQAIERIHQGETTIKEEKNKIRRAERIENIVEVSRSNATLDGSVGKFPVLYCDPPWQYDFMGVDAWKVENHYPTMVTEEICKLPVADVTTKDAILFMWATAPKLADAMRVIAAWGFTYKTCAIWDKDWTGMGNYFRIQHELLLIATRGDIPPPKTENRPASIVKFKRSTKHSEKPDVFYGIIEAMYPELPKLELFARQPREGWKAWGNEIGEARNEQDS